jgi:ribosomal protein S18 acetylase RimI-like enzyme
VSEAAPSLRPLRADEYDDFVTRGKATYAGDMIAAGVDADAAWAKADRDFAALLPNGIETEGHLLYAIDHDGRRAGYLWLADRTGEFGRNLFVYGLEVEPELRGRGLGRAAMELTEAEARRRGIAKIALNVFGGNDVARRLYASLGYREAAIFMEKAL